MCDRLSDRKNSKVALICVLICAACASDPANQNRAKGCASITEASAVAIAERFVRARGYTNEPADRDELAAEFGDAGVDPNFISLDPQTAAEAAVRRHGQVEERAYGIKDVSSGQGGIRDACWAVIFRYAATSHIMRTSPREGSQYARSVLVDSRGAPRMRHENWPIEYYDRRF
jgi:hypothetical protein